MRKLLLFTVTLAVWATWATHVYSSSHVIPVTKEEATTISGGTCFYLAKRPLYCGCFDTCPCSGACEGKACPILQYCGCNGPAPPGYGCKLSMTCGVCCNVNGCTGVCHAFANVPLMWISCGP